jgi:hypothetical protein
MYVRPGIGALAKRAMTRVHVGHKYRRLQHYVLTFRNMRHHPWHRHTVLADIRYQTNTPTFSIRRSRVVPPPYVPHLSWL